MLLVFPAALYFIRKPMAFQFGGRLADAAVGFAGGILGGLAGLSGPLPTLWASMRGWSKDQRRGVFQIFNWHRARRRACACRSPTALSKPIWSGWRCWRCPAR